MIDIAIDPPGESRWLRCTRCRCLSLRSAVEAANRDGVLRCSGCGHRAVPVDLGAEHDRKRAASGDRAPP
jgi:hypothetical protein